MNFEPLKEFLDHYVPMLGFSGTDTVVYKDREVIFRYQSGVDSLKYRTPVRDDALYNLYSCSKVCTVTAGMQLIERGEILANDPLYAYFPEYRDIKIETVDENGNEVIRDAKNPILIKHLFGMMSGLDYNLDRPAIKKVKEATKGKCPTLDVIRALPEDPFLFEPGERYQYSLSHDVLGGLIELVSGKKLGDYMKENIFDPLGMNRTSFGVSDDHVELLATQYNYDAKTQQIIEIPKDMNIYRFGTEYQSGGAGLVSCVDDYILLADALAHHGMGKSGERILSSRAVDVMRSPLLTPEQNAAYAVDYHAGFNYCYGVRTMTRPGQAGSLVPVGTFGWDGAKRSFIFSDPANKVAIFHAAHIGAGHSLLIPRIMNLIYAGIDED